MEKLQWYLELIDKMSGPGARAAGALHGLSRSEREAAAAAEALRREEDRLRGSTAGAGAEAAKAAGRFKDATGRMREANSRFVGAGRAMDGLKSSASPSMTGSLLQAAFWQGLARSILQTTERVAMFAGRLTFAVGKAAFDFATWGQATRAGLGQIAGDLDAGNSEFERTRKVVLDLALPLRATTDAYKQLRGVGFEAAEALDWTRLSADMKAGLTLTDEAVSRVMLAVSQIRGAGTLQGDELRQLQETGLNIDKVWQSISAQMGVGVQEAKKLKEQGKVSAEVALAAVRQSIMGTLGTTEAGEAAAKLATSTMRGLLGRARGQVENWALELGDRLMPSFDRIARMIGDTVSGFDKDGKLGALTEAIAVTFERAMEAVERAWPRIEALLGRGIDGTTDSLLELSTTFDDVLDKILDVAEFAADHWTALKWTFVGVSAAVTAAIGAIGVAATVNAGATVVGAGKMVAAWLKVGKAAAAAKAASAAGTAASAGTSAAGAAAGATGTAAGGAAAGAGAGAATVLGTGAAALVGVAAAAWQSYELWKENQDFDLFDVELIRRKMVADFEGLLSGIEGIIGPAAYSAASNILGMVTAGLVGSTDWVDQAVETGMGIVNGIMLGLDAAVGGLVAKAASLGTMAVDALKGAIGWHSPPAAFVELGEGSGRAYGDALLGSLSSVLSSLPSVMDLGGLLGGLVPGNETVAGSAVPGGSAAAGAAPHGGGGLLSDALAGLSGALSALVPGLTSPANDTLPARLPAAAGIQARELPKFQSAERAVPALSSSYVPRPGVTGGGTAGGGAVQVTMPVYLEVNGSAGDDPKELVAELEAKLPAKMRAEFQRLMKTLQQ